MDDNAALILIPVSTMTTFAAVAAVNDCLWEHRSEKHVYELVLEEIHRVADGNLQAKAALECIFTVALAAKVGELDDTSHERLLILAEDYWYHDYIGFPMFALTSFAIGKLIANKPDIQSLHSEVGQKIDGLPLEATRRRFLEDQFSLNAITTMRQAINKIPRSESVKQFMQDERYDRIAGARPPHRAVIRDVIDLAETDAIMNKKLPDLNIYDVIQACETAQSGETPNSAPEHWPKGTSTMIQKIGTGQFKPLMKIYQAILCHKYGYEDVSLHPWRSLANKIFTYFRTLPAGYNGFVSLQSLVQVEINRMLVDEQTREELKGCFCHSSPKVDHCYLKMWSVMTDAGKTLLECIQKGRDMLPTKIVDRVAQDIEAFDARENADDATGDAGDVDPASDDEEAAVGDKGDTSNEEDDDMADFEDDDMLAEVAHNDSGGGKLVLRRFGGAIGPSAGVMSAAASSASSSLSSTKRSRPIAVPKPEKRLRRAFSAKHYSLREGERCRVQFDCSSDFTGVSRPGAGRWFAATVIATHGDNVDVLFDGECKSESVDFGHIERLVKGCGPEDRHLVYAESAGKHEVYYDSEPSSLEPGDLVYCRFQNNPKAWYRGRVVDTGTTGEEPICTVFYDDGDYEVDIPYGRPQTVRLLQRGAEHPNWLVGLEIKIRNLGDRNERGNIVEAVKDAGGRIQVRIQVKEAGNSFCMCAYRDIVRCLHKAKRPPPGEWHHWPLQPTDCDRRSPDQPRSGRKVRTLPSEMPSASKAHVEDARASIEESSGVVASTESSQFDQPARASRLYVESAEAQPPKKAVDTCRMNYANGLRDEKGRHDSPVCPSDSEGDKSVVSDQEDLLLDPFQDSSSHQSDRETGSQEVSNEQKMGVAAGERRVDGVTAGRRRFNSHFASSSETSEAESSDGEESGSDEITVISNVHMVTVRLSMTSTLQEVRSQIADEFSGYYPYGWHFWNSEGSLPKCKEAKTKLGDYSSLTPSGHALLVAM